MKGDEGKNQYPECEKLASAHRERMAIIQFMEWLRSHEMCICVVTGSDYEPFVPYRKSYDKVAMEFLEIDEKKLDDERRVMLEEACGRIATNDR